jgi:hypothetical protein
VPSAAPAAPYIDKTIRPQIRVAHTTPRQAAAIEAAYIAEVLRR